MNTGNTFDCFNLAVFGTGLQRRSLGNNFDQRLQVSHSSFLATADNRFILACGFWDKSFRVFNTESGLFVVTVCFKGPFTLVREVMENLHKHEQSFSFQTFFRCYITAGDCDVMWLCWFVIEFPLHPCSQDLPDSVRTLRRGDMYRTLRVQHQPGLLRGDRQQGLYRDGLALER